MASDLLFLIGVSSSFVLGTYSFGTRRGEDKRGITAFPFLMFIGAAVAKYLGY